LGKAPDSATWSRIVRQRTILVFCFLPLLFTPALLGGQPAEETSLPGRLSTYRFECGGLRFEDILTLRGGARHLGKIIEWGAQVLVFDSGGHARAFAAEDVASMEFRRAKRHLIRPELPDLTVAYVERLPRDPSWHDSVVVQDGLPRPAVSAEGVQWRPAAGAAVTFRVHVLNAGGVRSAEADCHILVDGKQIKTAPIPPVEPGGECIVEATWPWQEGRQMFRAEVKTRGESTEIVKWNNTFEEPIHALGVAVVVAADRYEAFRGVRNVVDSYCFEDWAQHQLRSMNALMAGSVHPSSPEGALERVRCDRVLVVDDPLDERSRAEWAPRLRRDGKAGGLAEYAALLMYPPLVENEVAHYSSLKVDWRALRQVGAGLGLVDLRMTDTTLEQNMVLDADERYVCRQHLFPRPDTFMYGTGPYLLSERCVGYLNQAQGRPRGFRGEYLYQLPERIILEVLSNAGTPLEGVQVEAYQLHGDGPYVGTICGYGRDPLYAAFSDVHGRVTLLNQETPAHQTPNGFELRSNPFGRILTDGSNGLLFIRLKHGANEEYRFLPLYDMNVAFLRGDRREHVVRMGTRFAVEGSPKAPPWALIVMDDRSAAKPPLTITWKAPPGSVTANTEEFRIYKRTSFAGEEVKPWTLWSTVRKTGRLWNLLAEGTYFDETSYDGPYSLDTFYAVCAVDKDGNEGPLSPSAYLPYRKQALKFAIDTDEAYITLAGPGPVQMLHWDASKGTQPFGVRTAALPRYRAAFAGVAVTTEHRLVICDPVNHVLAFYDLRGNLEEVSPQRDWWPGYPSDEPGEFYTPADVAVDGQGLLYVADHGNNRVQVLDQRGAFLGLLDETFRFEGPHAVAFANGHLCVTDRAGTRVRVYRCEGDKREFVRQLPALMEADRAIVNREGNIYVTGRPSESAEAALLMFRPDGAAAEYDTALAEVEMGKVFRPRGLYQYPGLNGDFVYFVNDFPFDVRRYKIEPNVVGGELPIR